MKTIKIIFLFLLIVSVSIVSIAQNQNVGISDKPIDDPHPSSILELRTDNKGLLIPRVNLTDISQQNPISNPATSLLVYNTNPNIAGGDGQGFYYWDGNKWKSLSVKGGLDQPIVSTSMDWELTTNSAKGGGEVHFGGSSNVTTKGIVYSTSPWPTISSNSTNDGTGIGSFNSSIQGLNPNTTYFIRAYATNNFGTFYGNQVVITTK